MPIKSLQMLLLIPSFQETNQTRSKWNMQLLNWMLLKQNQMAMIFWTNCVRHPWWRTKQSWPLFSPTFFSFFYPFYFWTNSGKCPCLKICFPQYFGITRRNIFFLNQVIFIILREIKSAFFGNGQRSVAEPEPTRSPWSIPNFWCPKRSTITTRPGEAFLFQRSFEAIWPWY